LNVQAVLVGHGRGGRRGRTGPLDRAGLSRPRRQHHATLVVHASSQIRQVEVVQRGRRRLVAVVVVFLTFFSGCRLLLLLMSLLLLLMVMLAGDEGADDSSPRRLAAMFVAAKSEQTRVGQKRRAHLSSPAAVGVPAGDGTSGVGIGRNANALGSGRRGRLPSRSASLRG